MMYISLFIILEQLLLFFFFFFNDTATTEIYTLSLHDALPISEKFKTRVAVILDSRRDARHVRTSGLCKKEKSVDRKSTRLNSSHSQISYAVFCLKKKKNTYHIEVRIEHLLAILLASNIVYTRF